jgi:FtsP/CotA-like multicopper oxidase with cupredoxin domain
LLLAVSIPSLLVFMAAGALAQVPLDPRTLTKYIDPLPVPGLMPEAAPNYYEVGMWEIQQQLHAELPPATLWGYGPTQATASYPAATFLATRGTPIQVRWTNNLPMTHLLESAIDPTLHMAMPMEGVPACVHLHGGEVEPGSDGGPDAWFTQGFAEKGPGWQYETYTYPNEQRSATLFYHDHALGLTRLNLYTGLAGFYVIQDPVNDPVGLPSGAYDIGLALQDRMFTTDGQLYYPNVGDNPEHPVWVPEFFGDAMLVNGKAWPYLNVEPRKYRFRFLNGSNARFYSMKLEERITKAPGPAFYQIGSDGGLLAEPVLLNDPANAMSPRLVLGTGERADVVIDFSAYAPGTEFILRNSGRAPFPNGTPPDPQTVGQIMLFRVVPPTGPDDSVLPAQLASVDRLSNPTVTRTMTLNEQMGMNGPLGAFLNGMMWDGAVTETPRLGTTEIWEIANLTGDAHPIHLHLVQFQLLNRQRFNVRRYQAAWDAANPVWPAMMPTTPIPVGPYLKGKPIPPDANERGWKDTFRNNPGEVTRYIVRFAPQDAPAFSFDATAEPGYVWHCHIIEHEDNEMMRPYRLLAAEPSDPMMAARLESRAAPTVDAGITMLRSVAPNPAINGGNIRFSLRNAGTVEIDLYTVDGRHVKRLAAGWYGAGQHAAAWDRKDTSGRTLANGVYVVRFRGDGVQNSQKMIVLQ